MPSRWLSLGIVGFWLAMVGWFAGREAWTRYGQRPLLQDALREASADGQVLWTIKRNHVRIGEAETQVLPNPDTGSYKMIQKVSMDGFPVAGLRSRMDSRADIKPNSQLEALWLTLDAEGLGATARVKVEARPRGPMLHVRLTGETPLGPIQPIETEVAYDARDLFLSSVCPASRMPGLRPGLRWETALVDPTETLAGNLLPGRTPPSRPALVEVMEEMTQWKGRSLCYDVRAQHSNMQIRIWVREDDNAVVRQELRWTSLGKETVIEIERQAPQPEAAKQVGTQE